MHSTEYQRTILRKIQIFRNETKWTKTKTSNFYPEKKIGRSYREVVVQTFIKDADLSLEQPLEDRKVFLFC